MSVGRHSVSCARLMNTFYRGAMPVCRSMVNVQHNLSIWLLLKLHHMPAAQLQQLQAAIDEADGDWALVSNIVRDAAAAGRLPFRDMKRLVKDCDALTKPATCLGEWSLG